MSSSTIILTPVLPPPIASAPDHSPRITAWDMVERFMSSLGGNPAVASDRDIKTAVLDAYREMESVHRWLCIQAYMRINAYGRFPNDPDPNNDPSATIEFDLTGGAYERLLTLTGSTWPSWTLNGAIRINSLVYQIQQVIDSTRLQLTSGACPSADVVAGTPFALAQDTYTLPEDFIAADKGNPENTWAGMEYIRPNEWLARTRYQEAYAKPYCYTILGSPRVPGRLALVFYPSPDVDQTMDVIYHRKMRPIGVFEQKTGTVTISSNSTTATLSGATFKSANVGDVLRVSSTKDAPTDPTGENPFAFEATIISYTNATTVTLDIPAPQQFTATGYRLSSPLDLEKTAMLNAYVACVYKYLARVRRMKPAEAQQINQEYLFALDLAKEADSRDYSQRSVDLNVNYPYRYVRNVS